MFLANMLEEYVIQYSAFLSGRREKVIFPQVCDYLGEEDDY